MVVDLNAEKVYVHIFTIVRGHVSDNRGHFQTGIYQDLGYSLCLALKYGFHHDKRHNHSFPH